MPARGEEGGGLGPNPPEELHAVLTSPADYCGVVASGQSWTGLAVGESLTVARLGGLKGPSGRWGGRQQSESPAVIAEESLQASPCPT